VLHKIWQKSKLAKLLLLRSKLHDKPQLNKRQLTMQIAMQQIELQLKLRMQLCQLTVAADQQISFYRAALMLQRRELG
jgi:hypothetical protein